MDQRPGRTAPNRGVAMTEPGEADRQYARARELIARGRSALTEGHRLLRGLDGQVRTSRARGAVQQQIWEVERSLGHRSRFHSQAGQDAFLDERIFKGKRGGVFVEVGGYDGITGSNCLFFEMMRGWSGVLIEPSPQYHRFAAEFRRCTCLRLAVADAPGEAEFLDVAAGMTQMGGLVATYDPKLRAAVEQDPRHKGQVIKVKTRTLAAILDSQYLTEVDYISLDVEGGEMAILAKFPFEKYKITAWTIENNNGSPEIPALMRARGYKLVEALGVDDVYVLGTAKE